jgi:acetyl esterase/lipase
MSQLLTNIRNKVLATFVRQVAGAGIGASNPATHHDKVLQIPSRDADRTIKAHVYSSTYTAQPAPVLINFHGSGFIIPMHGTDDEFAMRIAKDTQYNVLDVQYRLAPEYPFPAGAHDTEDVVRYVLARPQEYDPDRIAVSGFSAGGNFALGLSGHAFPPTTFRHVIAFYPPINLAQDPHTKAAPDTSGRSLPAWMAEIFDNCYCPDGIDRAQPLVSPYYIDPERFSNSMLVITCAQDTLAPETEELVKRVQDVEGKRIAHERFEGCGHAWDKSYRPGTAQEKAKDRAYDLAVEILSS